MVTSSYWPSVHKLKSKIKARCSTNCETAEWIISPRQRRCGLKLQTRSKYWIVKGRAFVKKVIRQCVTWKKLEGKPFFGPSLPPLPNFSLRKVPPFTFTGVDFAGPLYIKEYHGVSSNKVWICLYTSCVVQVVHT